MLKFKALIKKFDNQGEKTGWTYIDIPAKHAERLVPGNKKSFRVKGKLDEVEFRQSSLLPMGQGDFILTLNAPMRKALYKRQGDSVAVEMEIDHEEIKPPAELMEILEDEPELLEKFQSLAKGTQTYYTNWINSAKTDATRARRIAATVRSLELDQDFGAMLRAMRDENQQLRGKV